MGRTVYPMTPVLVECLLHHEASLQQGSSGLAKAHAAMLPTAAPDDCNSSKSTDTQDDVALGSTDSTGTGFIPDLDTRRFPRAAQAGRTAQHGNRPCFNVSHLPLPTQVSTLSPIVTPGNGCNSTRHGPAANRAKLGASPSLLSPSQVRVVVTVPLVRTSRAETRVSGTTNTIVPSHPAARVAAPPRHTLAPAIHPTVAARTTGTRGDVIRRGIIVIIAHKAPPPFTTFTHAPPKRKCGGYVKVYILLLADSTYPRRSVVACPGWQEQMREVPVPSLRSPDLVGGLERIHCHQGSSCSGNGLGYG